MLSVADSVSLTEGCIVTITNNFGTSTVPAPASLIVWGVLGGCFVAAGVRAGALLRQNGVTLTDRPHFPGASFSANVVWDGR